MRKQRDQQSDERRCERLERIAQDRKDEASAEGRAMDAAVKRSIKLHGA